MLQTRLVAWQPVGCNQSSLMHAPEAIGFPIRKTHALKRLAIAHDMLCEIRQKKVLQKKFVRKNFVFPPCFLRKQAKPEKISKKKRSFF
jgi:hypothetical protein